MTRLSLLLAASLLTFNASALELAKYPQVFNAGKGISVTVAPSSDGKQALIQVSGINHPLDEVDEQHHIYLLDWMKHLAYLKRDSECYDKQASDDAAARFTAYCAQCKAEADRYRSKVHVVGYGGL
mgnify:CR=1 FL=1